RLREWRRWLRRLLTWRANLRRLPVIPLERQERRPHSEPASGDLLQVVVACLDPELQRVEWIGEANGHAHVVTIESLPQSDVGHGEWPELRRLDCHSPAVERAR